MHHTFEIDITDKDGCAVGRTVPVEIVYVEHIDKSYGEDADGRGGIVHVEHEIIDLIIPYDILLAMNFDEVVQVTRDAKSAFEYGVETFKL